MPTEIVWFAFGFLSAVYVAGGCFTAFMAGGAAYRHASSPGFFWYLLCISLFWPVVWLMEPRSKR